MNLLVTLQDAELTRGLVTNTSVSPHAPYSVSKTLFNLINEASKGKTITIHNQESAAENNLYQSKSGQMFELYKNLNLDSSSFEPSGKSSVQTYLPWLNNAAGILLVHNTFTNKEDVLFALNNYPQRNVYFCICINANQYIQSVNPPIELLRNEGCNITLGTDSYASNHQLNILEEIKTIHTALPGIPLAEMLKWATINGSQSLGYGQQIG